MDGLLGTSLLNSHHFCPACHTSRAREGGRRESIEVGRIFSLEHCLFRESVKGLLRNNTHTVQKATNKYIVWRLVNGSINTSVT